MEHAPEKKKKKKKNKKKRKKSLKDDEGNNNYVDISNKKKRRHNDNDSSNYKKKKQRRVGHSQTVDRTHSKYLNHSHQSTGFSSETSSTSLSTLQSKFLKKLNGAKFRTLNEELYTKPSEFSFQKFQEEPKLFFDYHRGFREQVKSWPKNPLDIIIGEIKKMPSKKLVVGDFGCGEAVLATSVPNKVYSFDLVAQNKSVIACNIANVPLQNNKLDVAVFCLALMGIDYHKFIIESHRVLKVGGQLLIAEVESRFCYKSVPSSASNNGRSSKKNTKHTDNNTSDILRNGCNAFISMVEQLGFKLIKEYPKSSYFVLFKFEKIEEKNKNKTINIKHFKPFPLKACIYKRR
jgi:hypothetical protein